MNTGVMGAGDTIMGTIVDAVGALPTSLQHSLCTVNTVTLPQDFLFWLGIAYGLSIGQEEVMYIYTHTHNELRSEKDTSAIGRSVCCVRPQGWTCTQLASFPASLTGVAPEAHSGNLLDNIPAFGGCLLFFFQISTLP